VHYRCTRLHVGHEELHRIRIESEPGLRQHSSKFTEKERRHREREYTFARSRHNLSRNATEEDTGHEDVGVYGYDHDLRCFRSARTAATSAATSSSVIPR